ncbi:MAG: right-handed parallel beta-helix repeat-containing protein, partial [Geminicoccaceae bacterium]
MAYLTVSTQADIVDPGDGKLSLREAVAQANAGAGADTIRFTAAVAGRRLVLTGGELKVTNSVVIDGSGGGAPTTVDADEASRVLSIAGKGTQARLNGLVLTNGRTGGQPGGGIALTGGAALTLTDCSVTANDTRDPDDDSSGGNGGGIYAGPQSALTIRRSTISDNVTGGYYGGGNGGGVAAGANGRVSVADSEISGNYAEYGGGINLADGGAATIERTAITANAAKGFRYKGGGGGIHLTGSTASVAASNVSRNFGYGSGGGGIFAQASTLSLSNTTVADNATGKHYGPVPGGGVKFGGSASFVGCTITGNLIPDASGYDYGTGGGIAGSGTLVVANTIVAGNFQARGSAGFADDLAGTITLSNGHNVFGSTVKGSIAGDREKVAAGAVFAALDANGGGRLDARGVAPLKDALSNP